ncbi:biliverdin-producing heme oxygenase [Streptosporangium sp. CA-115845]|uniref:biliverdin-producing heme oxygenase n=1 Tax=Streptosporangium sp. CA-115845 TaxID=3240071 RepID=UPI003D8E7AB1
MAVSSSTDLLTPEAHPNAVAVLWHAVASVHAELAVHLRALHEASDLDTYRSILIILEEFQRPAEAAICAMDWSAVHFDPHAMCRGDFLRADLSALGVTSAPAPRDSCPLTPIDCLPHAVGLAFVLLGSTMGGAKMAQRIAITLGAPTSFFSNPGQVNWQAFGAMVERALPDATSQQQAADAAVDTMRRLVAWTMTRLAR